MVNFFLPWTREKPLKMVWKVQKDGSLSYLVGTAHFFPNSFSQSLRRLIRSVEIVLTEGPLDAASMERIAEKGRDGNGNVDLISLLEPEAVQAIDRMLGERLADSDNGDLFLMFQRSQPSFFEMYIQNMHPWMALFSVWTTYLNWKYSVDLEAFQIARRMKKQIHSLETVEEQLAVLEGIPLERVQRHLNDIRNWATYCDDYVRHYLTGDLENLVAMTDRFPTRTPTVISERDQIMFARMEQIFNRAPTAALVGFPHIPGVRQLFLDAGYSVQQGFE